MAFFEEVVMFEIVKREVLNPTVSDIVLGCLFDVEALGITVKNESVRSIYNPRGRYFNNWYNWIVRWFNDQTENFIVLLLD